MLVLHKPASADRVFAAIVAIVQGSSAGGNALNA
jgi:hypothetical protein